MKSKQMFLHWKNEIDKNIPGNISLYVFIVAFLIIFLTVLFEKNDKPKTSNYFNVEMKDRIEGISGENSNQIKIGLNWYEVNIKLSKKINIGDSVIKTPESEFIIIKSNSKDTKVILTETDIRIINKSKNRINKIE